MKKYLWVLASLLLVASLLLASCARKLPLRRSRSSSRN